MTNLPNQLRAALYLLRRNIWPKVALVVALVVAFGPIYASTRLVAAPDGTVSRLLDFSPFLVSALSALPFCACLVAAGLVSADLAHGGARGAVLTEGGRRCYVASRLIAPALVVLTLEVLLVTLCLVVYLVGGLLGVVAVLDGEAFASALVQQVVPRLVLPYAYVALAALAEWLVPSGVNPLGVALLFGLGLVAFAVMYAALALGFLLRVYGAIAFALMGWLPFFQLNTSAATVTLMDANALRALVTAPVCVVLCYLAAQRLWARRTV